MPKKNEIEVRRSSARATIITGAAIGAGAGIIAAMLLRRRAQRKDRDHTITPGEALQLGLLLFGLFRAISALGDDDEED